LDGPRIEILSLDHPGTIADISLKGKNFPNFSFPGSGAPNLGSGAPNLGRESYGRRKPALRLADFSSR
jgi:hypothetical protein